MEFDKKRVYTILNADELKIGSKVIAADSLSKLKKDVLEKESTKKIKCIEQEDWELRFYCDDGYHYAIVYLIEDPNEKKLKWTDLKIGDLIKRKFKDGYIYNCDGNKN